MKLFKRYGEFKTELRRVQNQAKVERLFQEEFRRIAYISLEDLKRFDVIMNSQPERRHFVIPGVGFAYEIDDDDERRMGW